MRKLMVLAVLALQACTVIEPNAVRIYAEHVSHASQHFGSDPTNYGYDAINLELHYKYKGVFLDVAEGMVLEKRDCNVPWKEYGALDGPREIFTARAGYEWQVKP